MSLWTSVEAEAATLGKASRAFEVSGLSIDTRTLKAGDLFVALKGDNRDGHEFVRAAFEAKAGAALVTHTPDGGSVGSWGRCSRSATPCAGWKIWRARRGPQSCENPGRHRQRRKDHHQGNPAAGLQRAGPHPCQRRQPQQSLGRAAQPGRPAARCRIWRVRSRHEPLRRVAQSDRLRAPASGAGHHHRAGASGILRQLAKPSPTPSRNL